MYSCHTAVPFGVFTSRIEGKIIEILGKKRL
jgi:hypothetical protein